MSIPRGEDHLSEDYLRGYFDGIRDGNVYAHARVMKIRILVDQELNDIAERFKPKETLEK